MYIHSLTLNNFRNYKKTTVEFCPYTNILYGNNAMGKTNILEAVYLFSQGRSYRTKSDKEMILFGEDYARLNMSFSDTTRNYGGFLQFMRDGRKAIKINEVPITKLSMLMNYLNVVMFSPEDLELIKGAPGNRRRFLDTAISQMYPNYLNSLIQYHKALAQKNSLLKTLKRKNSKSDDTLSVWNEQLSKYAISIIKYRQEFLNELSVICVDIYNQIGKENLQIHYTPSINYDIIQSGANGVFEYLEKQQMREIDFGSSLYGVQRDDITFFINGNEAKMYGSQGQQRSTVLSLKMGQTEYIQNKKGEYPILLLDDVMSELDIHRREYLAEKIKDKQVLITCTDTDIIQNTNTTKLFYVENGTITV